MLIKLVLENGKNVIKNIKQIKIIYLKVSKQIKDDGNGNNDALLETGASFKASKLPNQFSIKLFYRIKF